MRANKLKQCAVSIKFMCYSSFYVVFCGIYHILMVFCDIFTIYLVVFFIYHIIYVIFCVPLHITIHVFMHGTVYFTRFFWVFLIYHIVVNYFERQGRPHYNYIYTCNICVAHVGD